MGSTVQVEELEAPPSPDAPGAAAFAELVALRNAVEADVLGSDLLALSLPEALAEYRSSPHRVRRHFLARDGGVPVGRAMVTTRPRTPGTGAHLMVDVLREHRGRGVGAALAEVAEAAAAEAAAPVLKVTVTHTAAAGGERTPARSGSGDVAADDPGARFLRRHGYVLEQVNRISLLPTLGLADRLDALDTAVDDDFRVVTWTGPTPAKSIGDVAVLRTRMSTDAPMAGLVMTEDPWDADRVLEHDDRRAGSGRLVVTAAAEHVPTGRLVGFTEVVVGDGAAAAVQEDTLVLREHRGHRLGLRLKVATARLLLREAPAVEAVVTWNAEENRPMLAVNGALGFTPVGLEGGWQRRA